MVDWEGELNGLSLDQLEEDLVAFEKNAQLQQAVDQGVDISSYVWQKEVELSNSSQAAVEDYMRLGSEFEELHKQIQTCDSVLSSMETTVQKFGANISNISTEIEALQDHSFLISTKVKNRTKVQDYLHTVITNLALSPAVIRDICSSEPNEAFVQYLTTINNCHDFFHQTGSTPSSAGRHNTAGAALLHTLEAGGGEIDNWTNVPLAEDLVEVLNNITLKVCSQLRDFLLSKIESLKKPKTNIHILQQNVLLKYKKFFYFLHMHHPVAAQEIKNNYVATMSSIYTSKTRSYISHLVKLEMGGVKQPQFLVETPKSLLGTDSTYSILGNRWELLDNLNSAIIVPHVEVQGKRRHYFENIFRSLNLMLIDIITVEYLFTFDFFCYDHEIFIPVFEKTIPMFLEAVKNWAHSTCDYIALLLCIHMTQQFIAVMERRRIPCLNLYFEQLYMTLWPEFKRIFDVNVDSLRTADFATALGKDRSGKTHKITHRYAEFSSSIFLCMFHKVEALESSNTETGTLNMDEQLAPNMSYLRITFENLMQGMANILPSKLDQTVFLINNFWMVLRSWSAKRVDRKQSDLLKLQQSLEKQVHHFVELRLEAAFSKFVVFLKQNETVLSQIVDSQDPATPTKDSAAHGAPVAQKTAAQRRSELSQANIDISELEALARDFSGAWVVGIKNIHSDAANRFEDRSYGMEILRQILLQLALYNARFTSLIAKCGLNTQFHNCLVSSQHILHEVRKYTTR